MLRIAIFDLPMESFGVLDWEITQSGPSFTFDTVQRAVHEFGQPVTIILGNEVFETLPDWKEPALLLKMADVIVVTRDPKLSSDPLAVLQRIGIDDATQNLNLISHSESTRTVEIFSIAALPYSSTTIRQETEKRWESNNLGRPPRGIERGVWEFIKANRLYAVTR
jgi:nicotinic acid mononucleotide adenylyltransferase